MSGAQLFVLTRLAEADSMGISELAARTATHQSSVSTVVERLRERGLVRAVAVAGDRRRRQVALTPRGRALLGRAPGVAQDRLIAAFGRLAAGDQRRLAELLGRWAGAIGAPPGAPTMLLEDEAPRRRR